LKVLTDQFLTSFLANTYSLPRLPASNSLTGRNNRNNHLKWPPYLAKDAFRILWLFHKFQKKMVRQECGNSSFLGVPCARVKETKCHI
jgi:hypothetical protein